jgi:hypothetical protein
MMAWQQLQDPLQQQEQQQQQEEVGQQQRQQEEVATQLVHPPLGERWQQQLQQPLPRTGVGGH